MPHHRILFIDAYDSFSNNIISLLREELSVLVETIKIDDARFVLNDDAFHRYLDDFDAVVAGPGPGHPANPSDIGLIAKLWTLPKDHLLPVFGICLGFQSLALEFEAKVERLREPRHGLVTPCLHCGRDIFNGTGKILATQYHSLHVQLEDDMSQAASERLWRPPRNCRDLVPLAWDLSDEDNGPVLMAVRHREKPFWGVQYHPESICTNDEGRKLIGNWWSEVGKWRKAHSRTSKAIVSSPGSEVVSSDADEDNTEDTSKSTVSWTPMPLPSHVEVTSIVDLVRGDCGRYEPILLESGQRNGKPVNSETGRFSIIGLQDGRSQHIRYCLQSRRLDVMVANEILSSQSCTIQEVFTFLELFMQEYQAVGGPEVVPFWGGLVGFVSYEAGLKTIEVEAAETDEVRPDIWFVFVVRSIVVDHVSSITYLQSVRNNDEQWLSSLKHRLHESNWVAKPETLSPLEMNVNGRVVSSPQLGGYCRKVRVCQEYLRAGSSYELCLTDTTRVTCDADPWLLYLRLRDLNPAPFNAYMHLASGSHPEQRLSLISSSPERFLSWSRDGKCQFRPIKGTVKKSPEMTRPKAEQILRSPKEQAENLMIVDLIRHDLSGVASVRNVRVPKLMAVEEYETVYQLVSVIEGEQEKSGIAVLAASLPPGSMTGAPKKRSCDLLQAIEEGKGRGLYAGVMGYLDVAGGGDFSVVIRSAFRWDNEEWRIGAGGAVTILSDTEGEWREMLAKRENVLRAFD